MIGITDQSDYSIRHLLVRLFIRTVRPKTGNPLEIYFCFSLFMNITSSEYFKKSYHRKISNQFSAQHKGGMVSVDW